MVLPTLSYDYDCSTNEYCLGLRSIVLNKSCKYIQIEYIAPFIFPYSFISRKLKLLSNQLQSIFSENSQEGVKYRSNKKVGLMMLISINMKGFRDDLFTRVLGTWIQYLKHIHCNKTKCLKA